MIDNDKKRIEEAARRYLESSVVNNSQVRKFTTYSTFKSGAEYEHPIAHKEGWNEAIDYFIQNISHKLHRVDAQLIKMLKR